MSVILKEIVSDRGDAGTTLQGNVCPRFDFCDFFSGHTRASGWFSDRFGKPRRHFCGDFYGHFDSGRFVLDEKLFYSDEVVEARRWVITVTDDGVFKAESDSLLNGAKGVVNGNQLLMTYAMSVKISHDKSWNLDMKDLMILQPDGSLHNITHVHKWGIRIGTVSAQYLHHNGDKLCVDDSTGALKAFSSPQVSSRLFSVRAQAVSQ